MQDAPGHSPSAPTILKPCLDLCHVPTISFFWNLCPFQCHFNILIYTPGIFQMARGDVHISWGRVYRPRAFASGNGVELMDELDYDCVKASRHGRR
jgi:hypothetical protein